MRSTTCNTNVPSVWAKTRNVLGMFSNHILWRSSHLSALNFDKNSCVSQINAEYK